MDYSVIKRLCQEIVTGRRRKNPLPKTKNQSEKLKGNSHVKSARRMIRGSPSLVSLVKNAVVKEKRVSAYALTSSYFRPSRYYSQYAQPETHYEISDKLYNNAA